MKLLVKLFIILLLSGGCANSLYVIDSYERHSEYGTDEIVVIDQQEKLVTLDNYQSSINNKFVGTSLRFKQYLIDIASKYKYLNNKDLLQKIHLTSTITYIGAVPLLNVDISGVYFFNQKIIFLSLHENDVENIYGTLWHEMGHVFDRLLNKDQKLEWWYLYDERLAEAGLKDPLYSNYLYATPFQKSKFPSPYCMSSVQEYFAEVFMYYHVNTTHSKHVVEKFNREMRLLEVQIKEVSNRYGTKTNSKEAN